MREKIRSLVALLTILLPSWAHAQEQIIPYEGYLDVDGVPVNSVLLFNFALYPCADTTACEPLWVADPSDPAADPPLWPDPTAEGIPLSVYSGRFSVDLGDIEQGMQAIPDALFLDQDVLYLAIEVQGAVLSDLQRLGHIPMSFRAFSAQDFHVTNTLTVAGDVGVGVDPPAATLHVVGDVLLEGLVDVNGDFTTSGTIQAGQLETTSSVWGTNIWEKIYEANVSGAGDHVIGGLNGNVDRRYMILVEGVITVTGSTNATIGLRPNGDAADANYTEMVQHWDGHHPGVSWHDVTGNTSPNSELLPLGTSHWNHTGTIRCHGEMNAATGRVRLITSQDSFYPHFPDPDDERIMTTSHANAWLNTGTNITSMTLTFPGAANFNGTIIIYRAR